VLEKKEELLNPPTNLTDPVGMGAAASKPARLVGRAKYTNFCKV